MTESSPEQLSKAHGQCSPSEMVGRIYHARVLLDSAAPVLAREVLSFVPQVPLEDYESDQLRADAISLYSMTCLVLGDVHSMARWIPELDQLRHPQATVSLETRVRCALALANIRFAIGDYASAAEICHELPFSSLSSTRPAAAFGVLAVQQSALFRQGRYQEAGVVCGQALSVAEGADDSSMQGDAWMWIGNLCRIVGNLLPALRMYSQAARLHQRAGSTLGIARDNLNSAGVYNRLGRVRESQSHYVDAERAARQSGDRVVILRTLIGQGMTSLRLGDFSAARRHLLTAWLDARRIKAAREICLCTEFLGELQVATGKCAQARRTLRLCRRIATRLAPEGDLIAELGIRESFLELTEQHWGAAEERAREAIDLCLAKGMAWEEAQARRLAGAALALRGDASAAHEELVCARDLFLQMGESLEVELTKLWLTWLEGDRTTPAPPLHPAQLPASATRRPATSTATELEAPIEESPRAVLRRLRQRATSPRRPATRSTSSNETAAGNSSSGHDVDLIVRPRIPEECTEPLDPVWNTLGLVTRSAKMHVVLNTLKRFAESGSNVLILGETGTGKELLARGVHAFSGREGRLIPYNCAGCTPSLVESELFGVERGAYTGADRRRPGLVRRASAGTLFLDEVGDLPSEAQGLLLRFLDSGEVRSLGSHEIRRVKLGVVAATLRPLDQTLTEQAFRPDLYFRLAEGFVRVPPLRERAEDIEPLLRHFWQHTHGAPPPAWLLQSGPLRVLLAHPWLGNIRELRHVIRRLGALDENRELSVEELAEALRDGSACYVDKVPASMELKEALDLAQGNRRRAAALLGISRPRLYRLIRKYGLETPGDS